jgi:hypothetical protein
LLRAECSTESIPQETGYNCYLSWSLFEKVVTRRDLEKKTLKVSVEEDIDWFYQWGFIWIWIQESRF